MKKILIAMAILLTVSATASAMTYEQARSEALFLTDKMAYELNLTDEQYEAAYEINLDYLMGVTGRNDVFGTYWERRNLDLSYILFDWQWNSYIAASYFYRPLYWDAGYWHFGIYRRYPHRDYFYFGRPRFYATYRGGHSWHMNNGRSFYYERRTVYRAPRREHFGMYDRWNRGDFRSSRHSSTRITGDPGYRRSIESRGSTYRNRHDNHDRREGNFRHNDRQYRNDSYRRGGSPDRDIDRRRDFNRSSESRHSGAFSGSRSNESRSSGVFGSSRSNESRSSGAFSGSRSSESRSSGAFGSSRSSGSFGGATSSPMRSSSRSAGSFGGSTQNRGNSHSDNGAHDGRLGGRR